MKILCIADIHGDREMALEARDYAVDNDIDRVLILGDFPGHGAFHNFALSAETAKEVLNIFKALKALAVPGNCDPQGITALLEEYGVNLHEKIVDIDGLKMAGFGGSNVTPFDTPFEHSEEEIYSRLKKLLSNLSGDKTVLALHCPPVDTRCDRTKSGTHAGSISIRKIIEENQPALAVCSHIHEAGGTTDMIGRAIIANIGRLTNGNIGVIESSASGVGIELLNLKKSSMNPKLFK